MHIYYLFIFILGLCVGSFLNVLIYRIPLGQEFVRTPSHCMACGHQLKWYENIPLVSYIAQGGKCRACGGKLSLQYPAIEAVNGLFWLFTALAFSGDVAKTAISCMVLSCLLGLSVIDWRHFIIPNGFTVVIALAGLAQTVLDLAHWKGHAIGALCVSGAFLLLYLLTGGNGIGFGDVKLMAAAGLLLGWQKVLLATILGSVLGCIIHLARMRGGAGRKLAFGPYLSAGIGISLLFGDSILRSYLSLFGL